MERFWDNIKHWLGFGVFSIIIYNYWGFILECICVGIGVFLLMILYGLFIGLCVFLFNKDKRKEFLKILEDIKNDK